MTDFELYEYSENKLKEAKKRIADLEKENAELKKSVNNWLKYEKETQYHKSIIKDLKKENADLEKENAKLKEEWQEQVQKATDEGYARTLQTMQLSKAKELLKRAQCYTENLDDEADKLYDEIEQFLSEVENDREQKTS